MNTNLCIHRVAGPTWGGAGPNPDLSQTVTKRLDCASHLRWSPSWLQLGRIIGRLEHVESGHQFHFNTAEELIACPMQSASDDHLQSQESQT